jgi:ankyrin repeat protein
MNDGERLGIYRDVGDVLARVQETVPFLGIELRDINQRNMFDDTPLIQVMSWEDIEAATLLLEGGADVSVRGEDGETALHRAVLFGNAELVKLLLAHDAPTSSKNNDGETPLGMAERLGKEAVVMLLNGKN